MPLGASTTTDSIVVFGSETFFKLSGEHTGAMPGKSGLGGASAARTKEMTLKSNAKRTAPVVPGYRLKKVCCMAERIATRLPTSWQRANAKAISRIIGVGSGWVHQWRAPRVWHSTMPDLLRAEFQALFRLVHGVERQGQMCRLARGGLGGACAA